MEIPDPQAPLAGLVSAEAEALYARLSVAGALRIGPGPDQIDVESSAASELFGAMIARRSPATQAHVTAVSEAAALRLLLAQRQAEGISVKTAPKCEDRPRHPLRLFPLCGRGCGRKAQLEIDVLSPGQKDISTAYSGRQGIRVRPT